MAVVDCSGEDRRLDFSVHMMNVKQGWQRELSMDQCGLVAMGFVCVLYFGLLSAQVHSLTLDSSANVTHPLRTCLTLALAVAASGALLQFSNAMSLARYGVQVAPLYVSGKLSKQSSKLLLTCIIMLISRGHGISHPLKRQHLLR